MELREAEKLVIVKPVASRPNCSKFRSFSGLLASAISGSSSSVTTPIKPRTIRLKPTLSSKDHCLVDEMQCRGSNAEYCRNTNVIYKPMARKATVPVLPNVLENSEEVNLEIPKLVKVTPVLQTKDYEICLPPRSNNRKIVEHSKMQVTTNLSEEEQSFVDSPSSNDDGYNWRKYGQKKVKGSEYQRSYYKCTYPNCPVKKKVEHTPEGQIAEIAFKGDHNHSKYRLMKHDFLVNAGNESSDPLLCTSSQFRQKIEGNNISSMITECNRLSAHSTNSQQGLSFHGPNTTGGVSNFDILSTIDHSSAQIGGFDDGKNCIDATSDEPTRKARKIEQHRFNEKGISVTDTNVVVGEIQTSMDSEITKDGFRWRKYGQKIVKGNSYPRSYYKCTNQKCNVRKYVERTSEDPNAFITTYEGMHNHEMQIKSVLPTMAKPSANLL